MLLSSLSDVGENIDFILLLNLYFFEKRLDVPSYVHVFETPPDVSSSEENNFRAAIVCKIHIPVIYESGRDVSKSEV